MRRKMGWQETLMQHSNPGELQADVFDPE